MRKVAIVGSGIAGLLTAHGLRRSGHAVTLYADRDGDALLRDGTPTGTAARFDRSLAYDRQLGLAHWDGVPAKVEGISLAFGLKPRNRLLSLTARFEAPALAIDLRLLCARWMDDLRARGGRVEIEAVTLPRLEQIAAQHDLTVIAAGRKELCQLFPRNPSRSVYGGPQRKLCLIITRGGRMGFDGVPFLPVRFNLTAGVGEAFWVPFWHKDHGATWNLLFEAVAGGPMDQFERARSGEEALAIARRVIAELAPWDSAWAAPMELADPRGWLVGAVAPCIREPVGRLPSGRVVTGVGDTIMSMDPIAGQGANNGTRMARHLVEAIDARGQQPLDADWMGRTFEAYWQAQGQHHVRFSNLLLEPLSPAGQLMLLSQYGSDGGTSTVPQRIADTFARNFDLPGSCTEALVDAKAAKAVVKAAGGHHPLPFLRGALGVARGQLLQTLGRAPGHPAHR